MSRPVAHLLVALVAGEREDQNLAGGGTLRLHRDALPLWRGRGRIGAGHCKGKRDKRAAHAPLGDGLPGARLRGGRACPLPADEPLCIGDQIGDGVERTARGWLEP